jgi:branched-chain amino acid transport system permease protein
LLDQFLAQLFSGLATGSIYACLSLAVVISYRSTRLVNFAQGEMATASAYIAWWLISLDLPYGPSICLALLTSFAVGYGLEAFLIRPIRTKPPLIVVTVSVAIFVIFNSTSGWIFGYTTKTFPSPFPDTPIFHRQLVSTHELCTITVVVLMMAIVFAFFRYTHLGLAMRAAADNPTSSELSGVSVQRMRSIGWGIAASLAGLGAILVAPTLYLDPFMMFGILIYSLAAATLGGIDSPLGAVLGAFIVGVAENMIGAYLVGNDLKLPVALALIITILIVRPKGLFGASFVARA